MKKRFMFLAVITAYIIVKEDTVMRKIKTDKLIGKIEDKFKLTEKKWYRVELQGEAYFSHVITEAIKTLSKENRNLVAGMESELIWYLNMDLEQKKAFELAARDYLIDIGPLYEEQETPKTRQLVYK